MCEKPRQEELETAYKNGSQVKSPFTTTVRNTRLGVVAMMPLSSGNLYVHLGPKYERKDI